MRGRRVSPGPRRDGKRTHGRTLTMHHPGSDRGEGGNRGNLGGPGRGTGDAGTTHRLPGKGDRSDSPGPRDGDGGPRTGTAGAVPGPRNCRDSNIWLANTGSQPIQIDRDEVVALAECVLAEPGASAGNDRDVGDGLVERASPHLTSEECRQLQTAMAARKHLFAKGKGDLGRTDIVQHQIHTGDQPAIKQRVRRYPAARREEERQLVEDMLAIGIIQESNSAWSSPTVLVKKKDGTTRFCIDYRQLNQATKEDAYPLPHIEDSLNTLGGSRFFCSLDLASGYWQVEMDAADREKTAFFIQGGLYEFRVMPFGLVNAPAHLRG